MLTVINPISASAALGTRYKFAKANDNNGTYIAITVTENINGGWFSGTRKIQFEKVFVAANITVTVKDKNGKVKTYANLEDGEKFGVPAGSNVVTFKCNIPKLPYYTHTTTQWFLNFSKWYWE